MSSCAGGAIFAAARPGSNLMSLSRPLVDVLYRTNETVLDHVVGEMEVVREETRIASEMRDLGFKEIDTFL
jgi:hypothetical protein